MANTDYRSVDEYIAAQPDAVRPVLETVRAAIRKAMPDAAEVISYQIPAYRLPGGVALYFSGWKQHYSIYPASDQMMAALGDELAPYRRSKGTLGFPLNAPVPVGLIERIAKFSAAGTAERAAAKAAAKKKKK